MDGAATSIADLDSSGQQKNKEAMEAARTNMNEGLKDPINKAYNNFIKTSSNSDYFSQIKMASNGFLGASIAVLIGLTIIYLIILAFNIKDKCHPMKFLLKIIMLLQLLLAVLILIMAAITTVVSILIAYACTGIDGAVTVPDYVSTKFKGAGLPSKLTPIINTCLYEKGDGNIFNALNVEISSANNVNNITGGMQTYIDFRGNISTQSAPYVGGNIAANISAARTWDYEVEDTPSSESTKVGKDKFNAIGCAGDIMTLKGVPSGKTGSTSSDASSIVSKNSNFAIRRDNNNYRTDYYASRYISSDCPDFVNAQKYLTNVLTAQDAINNKLGELNTDYNGNFYTAENDVWKAMKDSINDFDAILVKVNDAVSFLKKMNSSIPLLLDCRVMLKEVTLLENILCFRFGEDLYQESGLGLALGFIIFIYSWVMCCSIRFANLKIDGQEKYNENNGQSAVGAQNLQDGQNKNQYENYQ